MRNTEGSYCNKVFKKLFIRKVEVLGEIVLMLCKWLSLLVLFKRLDLVTQWTRGDDVTLSVRNCQEHHKTKVR